MQTYQCLYKKKCKASTLVLKGYVHANGNKPFLHVKKLKIYSE